MHGNAWEYNRLSAYTSNTETNNQLGVPKGTFTRNQFGFDVGGPVLKNRLFGFGSAEWIRVRSAANLTAGVPTPEFLAAAAPNIQSFFSHVWRRKDVQFHTDLLGVRMFMGVRCRPGLIPRHRRSGIGGIHCAAKRRRRTAWKYLQYSWLRADYNLSDKTQMFGRFVEYHEVDQPGTRLRLALFAVQRGPDRGGSGLPVQPVPSCSAPSLASATKLSFSRFNTFHSYDTKLQDVPTLDVSVNAQIPGTGTLIQLPGFYCNESGAMAACPLAARRISRRSTRT